ncbi:uncharacterized protein LOC132194992 [Neocloeon triangulifer]|uniref:uncharacterized protein LOC132194992 n=1 Tax=Neocloeon triangulifer TaxID=2078957 RepID=UPI00286F5890|nr:uncharacterized protein LOC132194992 [Neocloeon triangulifer]
MNLHLLSGDRERGIMAAGSKFERLVAHHPCGDLVHPWPGATCRSEFLLMGRDGALGTTPYMLIFFLAKLVVGGAKGKALREEINRLPLKIVRVSLLGATLASGIVGSICGFRWLFGRFRWWFVGLGPGSVAGLLSILTQDISEVRTFASYFYVAAVEYGVRKVIWRRKRMLVLETALFSALSAALVRLQHLSKPTSLPWFFYPEKCPAQSEKEHSVACVDHGVRGAARLATFGAILGGLRVVVPLARDLLNRRPVGGGARSAAASAWSFPAFLAAYVALQRWTRCLVAQNRGRDDGTAAAVSGAVAGLSYLLHPSLSILAAALASIGQLAVQDKVSGRWWPHLVFGLSTGWMLHARLNEPDHICPPFARIIFTECTRARADRIIDDYKNILQLNK